MAIDVLIAAALLGTHTLADFEFQTDWMAQNKSKRWDALALHVGVYSACFLWAGWRFALVTFAAHFVQDAITSRLNARWYLANKRHRFFCGIGWDQYAHFLTLGATWLWLQ